MKYYQSRIWVNQNQSDLFHLSNPDKVDMVCVGIKPDLADQLFHDVVPDHDAILIMADTSERPDGTFSVSDLAAILQSLSHQWGASFPLDHAYVIWRTPVYTHPTLSPNTAHPTLRYNNIQLPECFTPDCNLCDLPIKISPISYPGVVDGSPEAFQLLFKDVADIILTRTNYFAQKELSHND